MSRLADMANRKKNHTNDSWCRVRSDSDDGNLDDGLRITDPDGSSWEPIAVLSRSVYGTNDIMSSRTRMLESERCVPLDNDGKARRLLHNHQPRGDTDLS